MNWLMLGLSLFGMLVAYCAGHWRGYDKGEADQKEFVSEVKRVNKGSQK